MLVHAGKVYGNERHHGGEMLYSLYGSLTTIWGMRHGITGPRTRHGGRVTHTPRPPAISSRAGGGGRGERAAGEGENAFDFDFVFVSF